MTKDEALKLALEYVELVQDDRYNAEHIDREALVTTIKEALAQPEQPKVRTGNCLRVGVCASEGHKIAPQRTWVGLTDEEVSEIIDAEIGFNSCWGPEETFARAIEAKLKEKNT